MSQRDQICYERALGPIQNQRQRRAVWEAVKAHFPNYFGISEFESPPEGYVALGKLHHDLSENVDEMGKRVKDDSSVLIVIEHCMAWYIPHKNSKVVYPTLGDIKARVIERSVVCVSKTDVEDFEGKYLRRK